MSVCWGGQIGDFVVWYDPENVFVVLNDHMLYRVFCCDKSDDRGLPIHQMIASIILRARFHCSAFSYDDIDIDIFPNDQTCYSVYSTGTADTVVCVSYQARVCVGC